MKNGFKISNNKTKCMHFCQMHKQSILIVNDTEIPITHQYKLLGITLDPKVSVISHIKQLKIKYNQTKQLLKTIAHTDWGTDNKKNPNQTIQMSNTIKT